MSVMATLIPPRHWDIFCAVSSGCAVVARTVDGACFVSGNGVEPAALVEQLAYRRNSSSKQNPWSTAFLQCHLHCFRDAQTDAVWSFEDKFAQEFCQRARVDVLHRDGAALGAGNCLFGHKDDVVRLGVWLGILFDDLTYIILIGDDMGADCKTLV